MQEGQSLLGLFELVSGQTGQVLAPSVRPFGPAEGPVDLAGGLLGLAGLQGWAGGCVSGSWGSASLSWAQNVTLWWTEEHVKTVKL